MQTTQVINIDDIVGIGKSIIMWLAGMGIIIDLTPGIKLQPVRWLLKQLGNLLNHDIKKQIETLQDDLTTHKVDSWRHEILSFANSCMNHEKHTKEEFDHVIEIHDDYEAYIKKNNIENGRVKADYAYIQKIYMRCCENNSFLSIKAEDYE